MNRLRSELEGRNPSLAAVFSQTLEDHELRAAISRADVAEFRADKYGLNLLNSLKREIQRLAELPVLLTVRPVNEGGNWKKSEEERADLIEELLPTVDGVDIELSANEINEQVVKAAHGLGLVVVASMHDFEGTPSRAKLIDAMHKAKDLGGDFVKLAVTTTSEGDFHDLIQLVCENVGGNLIVTDMGMYGRLSRITLPAMGSRLAYASTGSTSVAPGQLSVAETRALINTLYPTSDD